jgi:prepilin-type N-terminal cleavage/methylation domain-containing protein
MSKKLLKNIKTQGRAFTLIELMVVVVIVAILSMFAINAITNSKAKELADLNKVRMIASQWKNSLAENVVGEWKFDEASGNTTYNSTDCGSALNGTIQGALVRKPNTDCVFGGCLQFDGAVNYVLVANNPGLQITGDQTIAMWLFPTDTTQRRNPFNKAYGGEGTITQEIGGAFNYFYGTAGTDANPYQGVASNYTMQNGKWYYVVVTRDLSSASRTVKWYFNGSQTNSVVATYAAATPSSIAVSIGDGYCYPYVGMIDEVTLYDKALAVSQIQQKYFAGLNNLLAKHQITIAEYSAKLTGLQNETAAAK